MADEYEIITKKTGVPYVVVGSGVYKFHEHSSDPREPSIFKKFDNFIRLVEWCTERQFVVAIDLSMRKDKHYEEIRIGDMTSEQYKNWIYLLDVHERSVGLVLSKYLNGVVLEFINWQIMKLTQTADTCAQAK